MFSLSFTPESLAALVRMAGFAVLLDEEVKAGLTEAGSTLTQAAVDNTWQVFANPSGELADSIYPWLVSPTQMEIRVGVPWGRRREEGFSGMTDSLGRFYPSDPAKPYLAPALADNQDAVGEIMRNAVGRAMARIGGQ